MYPSQAFLLLTLLSMMNCAVHQILKISLKIVLLVSLSAIYYTVAIIQIIHLNELYRDRFDWKEQMINFIVDGIFVLVFVVALIFHGHQTEATYRLDFIWKLQATGTYIGTFSSPDITLFNLDRRERGHGTFASIQPQTAREYSTSTCCRALLEPRQKH